MTEIQKIIKQFEGFNENLAIPVKDIIKIISDHLPSEEQQIRDVWEAGREHIWENSFGKVPNKFPDLESYISKLKDKP